MTKRKVKKKPFIILFIFLLLVGGGIFGYFKYQEYINSTPYKLSKLGYNEQEQKYLIENSKDINKILEMEYNPDILKFMKEKYYLDKNLDAYLSYRKDHLDLSITNIVSIINTGRDKEYYENTKQTDVSKKEQMLVNKYYYLPEDYAPENVVPISAQYAYANNSLGQKVLDIYEQMWKDAKDDGVTLIVTSAYRDYESQESTYDSNERKEGKEYADAYVARPGFSEHQTGLALDIIGYGTNRDTFEASDSFKWLSENAHLYGFILRYPKDKEDITGFAYEPWHYRYVGKEVAKQIKEENISFEEYYAYYIEGNQNK